MKETIDKPKIFISYAWGSEEYQNKVLSFATSLVQDGIDVLFDKWNLKEGNDTYAFMERSVTDPDVTNVLLLLDPIYEEKANARQGGVGTETQIISAEVYNKTEQTKFIPVVFERKTDGGIPKPAYLKQTLHFDLSQEENFDDEYQRLVKRLYGVEIYKKPEIGKKPAWVDKEVAPQAAKRITKYEEIKKLPVENDRAIRFKDSVNMLKSSFLGHSFVSESTDFISMYDELQDIKSDYLALMRVLPYTSQSISFLADSFESIYFEENKNKYNACSMIKLSLLHELFIYLVAVCYKNELFKELGYLLNRSYYSGNYNHEIEHFKIFYFHNNSLDRAVCARDDKNYFSGTAAYWMENIDLNTCTKQEFVLADVLCYNVSIFLHQDYHDWYWFPLTYVYREDEYNSDFKRFSLRLKSKEKLEKAALIFGFENIESFKERFREIREDQNMIREIGNVRYSSSFYSPETIFQFVSIDELGSKY